MSHASGWVPRRSPSRQSSFSMRSKADSAVEEEIVVAPDDGWHSDSSGSVYNASPRSPKAGGDASPAQYDSSKYAEQDEIGPVKVYTHTSAPRAIFPVRMISSRDGEEEVLVGRGGATSRSISRTFRDATVSRLPRTTTLFHLLTLRP